MHPALTREQVRRVDHLAADEYGIAGIVLMENAGRNAAAIIEKVYGPGKAAFVFCGPGNNGGDGFVISRHLYNLGWSVKIAVTAEPKRLSPDAMANYRIVSAMGLDITTACDAKDNRDVLRTVRSDDVVIDALLGTGFTGMVRGPTAELICLINQAAKRAIVAVDLPSGLDCDTGLPSNATIRADLTITFVAPKVGFLSASARPYLGRVEVADIGAPRSLVAKVLSE